MEDCYVASTLPAKTAARSLQPILVCVDLYNRCVSVDWRPEVNERRRAVAHMAEAEHVGRGTGNGERTVMWRGLPDQTPVVAKGRGESALARGCAIGTMVEFGNVNAIIPISKEPELGVGRRFSRHVDGSIASLVKEKRVQVGEQQYGLYLPNASRPD